MAITYRQLLEQLKKLNEEQLDSTITVCAYEDEYFGMSGLYFADEKYNDVLDHGHPYFEMM